MKSDLVLDQLFKFLFDAFNQKSFIFFVLCICCKNEYFQLVVHLFFFFFQILDPELINLVLENNINFTTIYPYQLNLSLVFCDQTHSNTVLKFTGTFIMPINVFFEWWVFYIDRSAYSNGKETILSF